jgi:uncharacterized protein (TIGR02246 family)
VAAAPVAKKAPKKGHDEAGIKAAFEKFSQAWAAGDAKARAACFTPDATLINPFGVAANGRDEMVKLFEQENKTIANGTTHTFDNFKITFIMDNLALVDCDGTVSGVKDPSGAAAADIKVHVFGVVVNRTGNWQMRAARPAIYVPMPGSTSAAPAAAVPPAGDVAAPPAESVPALDKDKSSKK